MSENPYQIPDSSFKCKGQGGAGLSKSLLADPALSRKQTAKKALEILAYAIGLSLLSLVVGVLSSLAKNINEWTWQNPMFFAFVPNFIIISAAFAFIGVRVSQSRLLYLFYVVIAYTVIGVLIEYLSGGVTLMLLFSLLPMLLKMYIGYLISKSIKPEN